MRRMLWPLVELFTHLILVLSLLEKVSNEADGGMKTNTKDIGDGLTAWCNVYMGCIVFLVNRAIKSTSFAQSMSLELGFLGVFGRVI